MLAVHVPSAEEVAESVPASVALLLGVRLWLGVDVQVDVWLQVVVLDLCVTVPSCDAERVAVGGEGV